MAGNRDLRRVTTIICNMLEGPSDGSGSVIDIGRRFYFGAQPVIDRHHRQPLFLELVGNKFFAPRNPASVEPNHCWETFFVFGIIYVQYTSFLGVRVVSIVTSIANIFDDLRSNRTLVLLRMARVNECAHAPAYEQALLVVAHLRSRLN